MYPRSARSYAAAVLVAGLADRPAPAAGPAPAAKRNPPKYGGGVFLFNRDGPSATLFVGLWKPDNSVGFNARGAPEKSHSRRLTDAPTLRVRVVGRDVTVWVDDKQVGEPYKIPDGLMGPELGFAVGGYGQTTLAFADLKVRKLPEGDGAPKP